MKEKKRKSKRIYFRVTEEEHQQIIEKSKKYPSISTLIIDAAKQYNVSQGRNRLDILIGFSELIQKIDVELVRVGNNLNQIAHSLHLYRIGLGEIPSLGEVEDSLIENLNLNSILLREIRRIGNKNSQV